MIRRVVRMIRATSRGREGSPGAECGAGPRRPEALAVAGPGRAAVEDEEEVDPAGDEAGQQLGEGRPLGKPAIALHVGPAERRAPGAQAAAGEWGHLVPAGERPAREAEHGPPQGGPGIGSVRRGRGQGAGADGERERDEESRLSHSTSGIDVLGALLERGSAQLAGYDQRSQALSRGRGSIGWPPAYQGP